MLERIPYFKALSAAQIDRLEQISIHKSYKKGEILFFEGERSQYLLVLLKGILKIYKTSAKGREIHMREIRPISLVAEMVNFEETSYPASGVFSTNGEVLKIDYEKFKNEFMSDPKICLELLKSMSEKIRALNAVFDNQVVLSCDGKIAKFINENFDIFMSTKYTRIAKILNVTPETFSRTITKFKKSGALILDDKQEITGFDKDKLKYRLMIKQPDFITKDVFTEAFNNVKKKKPNILYDEISFEEIEDGKSIQILHIGSYDNEPESFEMMDKLANESNLTRTADYHREIYLTSKAVTEKQKTILRYMVGISNIG